MDVDLSPIWEAVAWGRGNMEGLAILNQVLMRGLPSCRRVFGGRAHFSASLTLITFVKNVSLMNPYLNPTCTGGGFKPPMNHQGSAEASNRGGADAYLFAHQLDGRLVSADSLQMADRVRLDVITSAEKALCNLGTFAFVTLHLFSAGGRH